MPNPTRQEICCDPSCENYNIAREIELTDAEIAEREAQAEAFLAQKAEEEAQVAALEALKVSARAKLVAGEPMTAEEAATLIP